MAQKRTWTKAQSEAISDRGHDLLVSAGAGSGKTAVLTERIIRRLTDRENPLDITRMLIVTFTKAAANELKERISSALSDAAAENPSDRRLTRQLFALERAQEFRDSEEPISHIARAVGFNDYSYFSRCFRQYTGVAPAAYFRNWTK